MELPGRAEALAADIKDLRALLEVAERPKVKAMLKSYLHQLEAESATVVLDEGSKTEPVTTLKDKLFKKVEPAPTSAPAPAAAPKPAPCLLYTSPSPRDS